MRITRSTRSRPVAAVAATALALMVGMTAGLDTASATPAPTPDPSGASPLPSAQPKDEVTLITGDRVMVDAHGKAAGVLPAKGRTSVPMQISEIGGHTYVLPADADAMLAAHTLDMSLFDVTELSRPEYRELTGGGVPIIVTYGKDHYAKANTKARSAAPQSLLAATDAPVHRLDAVHGEAMTVPAEDASAVWASLTRSATAQLRSSAAGATGAAGSEAAAPGLQAAAGVASISLDRVMSAQLDTSVPQIGAPEAWQAGYDGTGVRIAVLDTGIDTSHPDLESKVVAEKNFTPSVDAKDHQGHGTHVASTAAGTGAASDGRYKGVATGAELLNGKVLGDSGSGLESGIIEGMEWAVEQGADIVSMSLGSPDIIGPNPLEDAVNRLSDQALFVIAAGNSGPSSKTVGTPGTAQRALTVGAVDKQDVLASFSSRGPRLEDSGIKPDVTAPGVGITAANAAGTLADKPHPAPGYVTLDGTSMATPHVAGAAALLAQQHPDWSGAQLKAALMGSAEQGDYTAYEQGSGRVDVARAVRQTVISEPGSINFGRVRFPHTDDEPLTKTITYRNSGTQPVALDLSTDTTGPQGVAPEGFFTLSADQVTVPAGGTASVDVTADTRLGGDTTGAYTVTVTASGDGQTVRSLGGLEREAEVYDITFEATDRDGNKPEPLFWNAWLTGLDNNNFQLVTGTDGMAQMRVPKGDYNLVGKFFVGGSPADGFDLLSAPKLKIDKDMTIELDARQAKPLELSLPDPNAKHYSTILYTAVKENGTVRTSGLGLLPDATGSIGLAQIGTPPPADEVTSYLVSRWIDGNTEFHIADTHEGGFYTGHTQHVTWKELAKLTTDLGGSAEGAQGADWTLPADVPGAAAVGFFSGLPSDRTVYLQGGYRWQRSFRQINGTTGKAQAEYSAPAAVYRAGQKYSETFNNGAFGPLLGDKPGLVRDGDTLTGRITPFADGAGHSGSSLYDAESASTTLYRDGEKYATFDNVLDSATFRLPPDKARYRLVTTVSRAKAGVSATSSTVTWEADFTSGHTTGATAVPASVVRYTPKLALDSTATAGKSQSVPVTVQGSSTDQDLATLKVSVSYDGGKSWQRLAVRNGKVTVHNPAAGGSVSFRAEVRDRQDNAFTQTITDAYRTR
ncbi:S8 family serine peptidase [Streptomyces sp. NPDC057486]|uniref:S8 family peptidase n=1 Tax=Streptomyces sp. NPDC057486 TaxID=3346145 RepID=UPI0036C4CD43